MTTIILAGVPGCGKSSIIKEATSHFPHLTAINYGDVMLEKAAASGLSRDALRKKPLHEQQHIGKKAAEAIAATTRGLTIIDTHALIRLDTGFCPGLPKEVLDLLSPAAFVLVETNPTLIAKRRSQDSKRTRDTETEQEISLHQELTRAYLVSCCMLRAIPLCHIDNTPSSTAPNTAPLIALIDSISNQNIITIE